MSSVGERYRATSSTTARLLLALAAVAGVGLIVWFCWAVWFNSHPKVTSSAQTFPTITENKYVAVVDIAMADGVEPSSVRCVAQVQAKDGNVVGQLTYTPTTGGAQTVTVPTLRRGSYFDWQGCTAPGQDDPR